MKHQLQINYNGETKTVIVEPPIYQDRQLFEVNNDGQFFIIYKEDNSWQQDSDHDFDEEWLTSIDKAIEDHPDIKVNVTQEQTNNVQL